MAILGRELLTGNQRHWKRREVTVEGFDGSFLVRELDDDEGVKVRKLIMTTVRNQEIVDTDALSRMSRLTIRYGWIDETGDQVLKPGEENELGKLPARVVDAISAAILEMSGLKSVGESASAEKN